MEKAFTRINWENTPSMATPLNEDNLNEGDAALDTIDDRVIVLDTTKANQSDLLQTVKTVTYNTTTGVFVFTWWNGTTLNVDLNIEKIPVTFSMDANGVITMTTADGSTYTADVGSLIKQYSFVDSSEIDFTVTVDAQTGDQSITASIKDGSITGTKLQPNYLADVTTQAQQANSSATSASGSATNAHNDALLAQSYAVGTGGTVRTGDATDNSKYYKEQAEQAAADAQAAAHVSTMTLSTNGIGRPDGTTITVDANGVFTATSGQVFIYPDPNVLPSASTANDKAIYLIDDPTATGADICTEWVVVTTNNVKTWKQIGDTSVDLSGYATTAQLNTKVNKTDMASIEATGTTNTTGSTIEKDTYFWLNGSFVRAKADIAINATFTANANYETVDDVLNTFEGGSGVPAGGTAGQMIVKQSAYEGDAEWKTVVVELTKAQYDALPASKNSDNIDYHIIDIDANIVPGSYTPSVNLGTSYTAELKQDISSGKFQKAIVGGYLTINGHIYDFVHPDYWLHTGDTECTTHHMAVVPRASLGTGQINSAGFNSGYNGCDFRTGNNSNTSLADLRAIIEADFGANNILSHRVTITNNHGNSGATGWTYANSDIDLMSETMVYGKNIVSITNGSAASKFETGFEKTPLKLFQERPDLLNNREAFWLRSTVDTYSFCLVNPHGLPDSGAVNTAYGLRPIFAIC